MYSKEGYGILPTTGEMYLKMKTSGASNLKFKNGLAYFEISELAEIEWVNHAFLTRLGGISSLPFNSLNLNNPLFSKNGDLTENVERNKHLVASAFDFKMEHLILPHQTHSDGISILKDPLDTLPINLNCDAVITNAPYLAIGVVSADCLPILVADVRRRVIAAVHAGRKGTALCIIRKVLSKMKEEFGCLAENLLIGLGPSIGSCCYEIDQSVLLPEWEDCSTYMGKGKWILNLAKVNTMQIKNEGIRGDQIFSLNICTHCNDELFFSYRKTGRTGGQLSFIELKG